VDKLCTLREMLIMAKPPGSRAKAARDPLGKRTVTLELTNAAWVVLDDAANTIGFKKKLLAERIFEHWASMPESERIAVVLGRSMPGAA
jgi:hypothetical protein